MSKGMRSLHDRIDARTVIRPELALGSIDLSCDLAGEICEEWFQAIEAEVERGRVVVFEHAIVGQASPFLLEVHHLAGLARSVVELEPDDLWAEGEDEFDTMRLFEQVDELLNTDDERRRCTDWYLILAGLWRGVACDRMELDDLVDVGLRLELLMAFGAARLRVGSGIVLDVWPRRSTAAVASAA